MAPPKKSEDAFAGLFQSATKGSGTATNDNFMSSQMKSMSLSERQRMQQQQSMNNSTSSVHSSYSNLASLSAYSSRTNTPTPLQQPQQPQKSMSLQTPIIPTSNNSSMHSLATPQKAANGGDDPFAIFYNNQTSSAPSLKPQTTAPHVNGNSTTKTNGEISLLDDEFTDAFFQSPPAPSIAKRPASTNPSQSKPLNSSTASTPRPSPPIERPASTSSTVRRAKNEATSNRDGIIAELIDIGFPIELANEAIDNVGLDLQQCVNYIMAKSSGRSTPAPNRSQSNSPKEFDDNIVLGNRPEGIKFNDISNDLFKRANKLINISKRTVLKNFETLHGVAGSSSNTDRNVPQWMKNQEKYKSEAIEKKYGGEDYGTDEENINQEEIERFMRLQKEKSKERSRTRFENGDSSRETTPPTHPPRPQQPVIPTPRTGVRPQHEKSDPALRTRKPRVDTPPADQVSGKQPISSRESSQESSTLSKPTVSIQLSSPTPEIDLLGLSDTTTSTVQTKQQSKLRDSSRLNQFDETDYNIAKEKATEAYKIQFRVIILSNLASVYKLSGHLKESLESIEEGLNLIEESEISNPGFMIAEKSVKYWYTKLIMTKAEVLELLERFEASLDNYQILIKKLGCNDKKIMDGKRRVDKIVNPTSHKPTKPTPKPSSSSTPTPRASTPIPKQPAEEEVDILVKDKIDNHVQQWAQIKQNNLRAMLTNLDEIIPPKINMKESLRKLTLNDLMLPKQVKIQYMRVISSIHPDKLASQCKGDKETELICNGVL
ncbi:SWA2 [[Candida] subhashii]|uniref:SWA2 n=1 Tax=[Candida] subhashii TaxID=561895 RepID=A0A8J5UEB3_9ASCO|nr:SWA2 [[Candida] subhashii]KAG7660993.1 SWA2 [[Candida] subhashii]